MRGQCETSQRGFQQRAQETRLLLLCSNHQNFWKSVRLGTLWRPFVIMEIHYICFLGILCFASNTLLSKSPLNSLPVQNTLGQMPSSMWLHPKQHLWTRKTPEFTLMEGSWEPVEEKQETLWTQQHKNSLVPNSLSSKGTSAVCMEAELWMRLIY